MEKEESRKEIQRLMNLYNQYKNDPNIMKNEKQICDSLIRPFFRDVLGWNIEDPYEFKSEYNQGGKRIDYLVCIEDVSQFVVEAKAPDIEIKDKTSFYRQAIQYAEAKGKDFAILTNFKTFILLRAGIETRGPLVNEIIKIDLSDLTDTRLDFLLYFAKDFWIEKGKDNPLYSIKNLKKKRPLDEALVEDMSKWREYLLRSLKSISKEKYDFDNEDNLEYIEEEVQRFIDRLIFICYCEDKQLVDNELKPILREYEDKHIGKKTFIIGKIKILFEKYNRIYNSDLFKEGLCDEFEFDDNILREIIEDLRGPYEGLPYDFSVIDADILGRAYENFLGHITTGKVRFREKKDIGKRKKMGIYYTPQHIVNYIVKNTVREKIKNKTFDEILNIKILDPACGSGSFLIKAYDILIEESKIKLNRELTYEEKEKLMLNCIHGVDLDERACDIVKLNLSLKLAERGKKLPALHNNIKNGNSLIDDPNVAEDKAFDWDKEFPFKFDVVIGNPPWVFTRGKNLSQKQKEYFNRYLKEREIVGDKKGKNIQSGKLNLYSLFLLRVNDIIKENSFFSFIIPNGILRTTTYDLVRKFILDNYKIESLVDVGSKIFEGVTASSLIFLFIKENDKTKRDNNNVNIITEIKDLPNKIYTQHKIKQEDFYKNISYTFNIFSDTKSETLTKKINERSHILGNYCKYIIEGIVGSLRRDVSDNKINENYKKLLIGKDIKRYYIDYKGKYINYDRKRLHRARPEEVFLSDKILVQRISGGNKPLTSTLDKERYYTFASLNNIILKKDTPSRIEFILALLNSKLINWYYSNNFSNKSTLTVNISKTFLEKIPIKPPESKDQEQKIIDLVNKMLELQKEYYDKKTLRKDKLEDQIKDIDYEIDQEVYKLYGLTDEEIKIVEESLG